MMDLYKRSRYDRDMTIEFDHVPEDFVEIERNHKMQVAFNRRNA